VTSYPTQLGRYQLIGQLATGGMAEIHLARLAGEAGFEKTVVVKRLLPELVASPAYVAMFLDEGKLVARLDHPNICEVHELGKDGAEYFLAMPYLDGVPVSDLIARPREPDRRDELRIATAVIAQACAGLHHAHELRDADGAPAGLVHRDISPSNLFVTSAGVVKVLDFGVAKVRGQTETEAGTIKGKTQYMAPEQLLGEPLDRRCDVFALGIVLFELATHQRLFKRASDYLTARAILEEPIPRADTVDPAIPPELASVIDQALARDKAKRFPDAAALAAALETAMTPHGGLASPAQIAAVVTSTDELSAQRTRQAKVLAVARSSITAAPTRDLRESPTRDLRGPADPFDGTTLITPHRRSRAPLAIGVLVLVAGATTAVVLAARGGSTTSAPDATPLAASPPPPIDAAPPTDAAVDAPEAVVHVQLPPPAPKAGTFSIDSRPYAKVYIDGKYVDVTPIIKRSIAAGRHKVRLVLVDGRARELTLDVPPGRAAPPINITTW